MLIKIQYRLHSISSLLFEYSKTIEWYDEKSRIWIYFHFDMAFPILWLMKVNFLVIQMFQCSLNVNCSSKFWTIINSILWLGISWSLNDDTFKMYSNSFLWKQVQMIFELDNEMKMHWMWSLNSKLHQVQVHNFVHFHKTKFLRPKTVSIYETDQTNRFGPSKV